MIELKEKLENIFDTQLDLNSNNYYLEIIDNKISGYIILDHFIKFPPIIRQRIIWEIIKKEFYSNDLDNITFILTLTPEEFKKDGDLIHNS